MQIFIIGHKYIVSFSNRYFTKTVVVGTVVLLNVNQTGFNIAFVIYAFLTTEKWDVTTQAQLISTIASLLIMIFW